MRNRPWMSILLLLVVISGASAADSPPSNREQQLRELMAEFGRSISLKDPVRAEQIYRDMITLAPEMPMIWYNLSCTQARQGNTDAALDSLTKSVELGMLEPALLRKDPDLESLRTQERFQQCIAKARKNQLAAPYEKGGAIKGLKTEERYPEEGLRYRLRLPPDVTAETTCRLVVWLHPSGGSMNAEVERLAPIYAGETLILPDHGATLRGIDPVTGQDLWKLDGKSHRFQVPAKWTHQGKDYVLSLSDTGAKGAPAQVHCIEPASGKILWSQDLGPSPSKGVLVHGDTMTAYINLADTGGGGSVANVAGAQCVAFRLNLTKPELLWQTSCPYVSLHTLPSNNGQYVVIGVAKESRMLDAATGKEVATYTGSGPFNEGHVMFVEDRVLLSLDGSHGHSEMVVLGATPATFAKPLCTWDQPHPQTTSYHNKHMTFPAVEGRIFFRGTDGVYCYDLRRQP